MYFEIGGINFTSIVDSMSNVVLELL